MNKKWIFGACLSLSLCFSGLAKAEADWVKRSNQYSQILLEVIAQLSPESAAELGVNGFDNSIIDLKPGINDRAIKSFKEAKEELLKIQAKEQHPAVRQDLEILLTAIDDSLQQIALEQQYYFPYFNASELIYNGLRSLLDHQKTPEQHQAALVRLQRYTGMEIGYQPLTELARAEVLRGLKQLGKSGPLKESIEKDLQNSETLLKEIETLFTDHGITGFEKPYSELKTQIAQYNEFIRSQVLPRGRDDFKLPKQMYAFALKEYGVDMPLDELQRRAKVEFKQLQNTMQAQAMAIAKKRGYSDHDYRAVLKSLKKQQITGEAILPFYHAKNDALEEIIKREQIITLPERDLVIRLASPAESAQSPAPFMKPPRMIGNTGEVGEFVLPLKYPGAKDGQTLHIDDFTYEAAAWPLSAHEARPGHELQFASMVEKGVSTARMIFAFNSVNAEGWALYMEEEIKPYLTLEGQFATNWSRLIRAARAFLDPGLNTRQITKDQALKVLKDDLVLSDALATSELERYTFRGQGQATSYFVGYSRLMSLRAETELLMADKFNRQKYHDFILAQGLLPPALLKKAVMTTFVNSH
ncbi:DUF885 domain-containing protein [Thalassomonas actiniarum]|uniref:DUF885 domain-containing protein n=1 Tax=Thalassomonas actiniarum TaxID=485447 RepID=A0AAF0C548_9GAMM|nr:DUF885 domain-containing protein [Thalassomonas actiniarum]WDE00721.1 DUF885 domain-containing protein [Thalassomonas actiniarum]